MQFTFNSRPYKTTPYSGQIQVNEYPMFKYAGYRFAYDNSPREIRDLLDSCPVVGGFDRVLVDVKVHTLNSGECPCLFGWHLDGHPDPFKYPKPAVYHLFLIGEEHSRTLFLDKPITLDVNAGDPKMMDADYKSQIAKINPSFHHAPERKWVSFTSEDFHSGPVSAKPCQRLLVRVCETNWVTPHNRIVTESFKQIVAV